MRQYASVAGLAFVLIVAGCGGGHSTQKSGTSSSVSSLPAPSALRLRGQAKAQADAGRAIVERAGCLACHAIAGQGNDGPGQNLTHIGSQLTSPELSKVIRHPRAPMPSFAALPPHQLSELTAYLHALH
jgi:mono/diheme cytochrome c family protein